MNTLIFDKFEEPVSKSMETLVCTYYSMKKNSVYELKMQMQFYFFSLYCSCKKKKKKLGKLGIVNAKRSLEPFRHWMLRCNFLGS